MQLPVRRDKSLNVFFVCLIVLLFGLIACLLLLRYVEGRQIQSSQ